MDFSIFLSRITVRRKFNAARRSSDLVQVEEIRMMTIAQRIAHTITEIVAELVAFQPIMIQTTGKKLDQAVVVFKAVYQRHRQSTCSPYDSLHQV